MLYFLKNKCPNNFFLGGGGVNPNMSKHISRNREATIKASPKTAHDKVFFNFGAKRPFFSKKLPHHQKKL